MSGHLDQHPIWFGCFLLVAWISTLLLVLYLLERFIWN